MPEQSYSVEPLETAGLVDLMLLSPEGDTHSQSFWPDEARELANKLLRAADDVDSASQREGGE